MRFILTKLILQSWEIPTKMAQLIIGHWSNYQWHASRFYRTYLNITKLQFNKLEIFRFRKRWTKRTGAYTRLDNWKHFKCYIWFLIKIQNKKIKTMDMANPKLENSKILTPFKSFENFKLKFEKIFSRKWMETNVNKDLIGFLKSIEE